MGSVPRLFLLCLLGCASVVVACGGDDSAGGSIDAATTSADAGPDGGIDAGDPADAATADFSGLYLLSIQRRAGDPLRFLATVAFSPSAGGGTAAFSLQPLKVDSCPAVGEGGTALGSPIAAGDVEVDDAAFDFTIADAFIAGEANPVLCSALSVDLRIAGVARGDGSLCGEVWGPITLPPGQAFDGGTFGAVPVVPGAIGDPNLPDPVTSCAGAAAMSAH
jgi:hypothetical protein